jgi:hypothetical protein
MSGARYTVCTGEGMIDMLSRMPGPKNYAVWISLVAQFAAAMISIAAVATAAGVFLGNVLKIRPDLCGMAVALFCLVAAWSGGFNILKILMSVFVLVIICGVVYVAGSVLPETDGFFRGLAFGIPEVPEWAQAKDISANPWDEILPLLGWGAGGFASQVWYTYWVLGAGYGAAEGRGYGRPADESFLAGMSRATAEKIKGWCRAVYTDATTAMVIGCVVTVSFLIAGAGILRSNELVPEGPQLGIVLSEVFSSKWGSAGGAVFLVAGGAALVSTVLGQLAGWPRLLADSVRICIPAFGRKFAWKIQFRMFLILFFISNMILVNYFQLKPEVFVKLAAVLDGLLLTPLQALWVGIGLYYLLPRMLSEEAYRELKPHWIFKVGLVLGFIFFGYFCVVMLPSKLFGQ